jgi:hypothetical protein
LLRREFLASASCCVFKMYASTKAVYEPNCAVRSFDFSALPDQHTTHSTHEPITALQVVLVAGQSSQTRATGCNEYDSKEGATFQLGVCVCMCECILHVRVDMSACACTCVRPHVHVRRLCKHKRSKHSTRVYHTTRT